MLGLLLDMNLYHWAGFVSALVALLLSGFAGGRWVYRRGQTDLRAALDHERIMSADNLRELMRKEARAEMAALTLRQEELERRAEETHVEVQRIFLELQAVGKIEVMVRGLDQRQARMETMLDKILTRTSSNGRSQ